MFSDSKISGTTLSEITEELKNMSEDELVDLYEELIKQYDL